MGETFFTEKKLPPLPFKKPKLNYINKSSDAFIKQIYLIRFYNKCWGKPQHLFFCQKKDVEHKLKILYNVSYHTKQKKEKAKCSTIKIIAQNY